MTTLPDAAMSTMGSPKSVASGVSAASPIASKLKTGPPVKFGVTDPISLQEPSDGDLALSERMMDELQVAFPAETPDGMHHRQAVLQELESMVMEWMSEIGAAAGMSEEEIKRYTVKITTLGSYRLGVVHPGSDIDTLCIAPPHIRREEFFTSFADKLSQHQHVSECVPIPEAYTPIIKMKFRNVYIDLLFARLMRPLAEGENPEDAVMVDDVLMNMDEKSVRCMNGFRVAEQILQLVPNKETFRQTLRFVKYWARRRGIYSNVLGFFGGITWSLMVARVCQLYPYYAPSQLVSRFFRVYDQWNWTKPVLLCDIVDNVPGMTDFKVWNPKLNPTDKAHIMPVITPAFPSMNSTHNVTETTKRILLEEFRRGYDVVKQVESQRAEWSDVHDAHPFFKIYDNFLWVEMLAVSDDELKKFSGWVESKLRILTIQLEQVSGMMIHPNPYQYDFQDTEDEWPCGCSMFIGFQFTKEAGAFAGMHVDLRSAISQFLEVVNNWSEREAHLQQFRLRLKRIRKSELPDHVVEAHEGKSPVKRRLNEDTGGNAAKKPRK